MANKSYTNIHIHTYVHANINIVLHTHNISCDLHFEICPGKNQDTVSEARTHARTCGRAQVGDKHGRRASCRRRRPGGRHR